jgi:hypothetical protein
MSALTAVCAQKKWAVAAVVTCLLVRNSMYANYCTTSGTIIRVNISYSSVVAYMILESRSMQSCNNIIRVVQREGLTVQRHRHTFDGSCYGVTALFHGVTRC